MSLPQNITIVYDLIDLATNGTPTEVDVEELKNRAELVYGKTGLNLAEVQKCYFEERIYETLTKWVLVLDLYFPDSLKIADIRPDSIEMEAIDRLVPVDVITTEKQKEWDETR